MASNRKPGRRFGLLASAAAAFVAFSSAASAQQGQIVPIAMQSQDLGDALNQLARQTNVQIVFRPELVRGRQAPALSGNLTAQQALDRMLDGTGLTYRPSGRNAYVILTQAADTRPTQTDVPSEQASVYEEDLVVTAQRGREESLFETPISVGVLSGGDLDRGSSRSAADVINQIPGVTVIEGQPGNTQITIRGVSAMAGTTTSAYYLDEVPFAFIVNASLPDANAFDLERVEVLRGPQGTLYGANALSGVVRILTNNADLDDFDFRGRVRVSDTDGASNVGGDLAINVPLAPGKLAVRGVVGYSDLSGFIDSTLDGQDDINDTQARSYRLRVNYQPTEDLSFNVGYTRSDVHNGAPASSLADLTTPFSSHQPDDRVYDTFNIVGQYSWNHLSLLSSTSYLTYEAQTEIDQGFQYNNRYTLDSFSQEIRLLSRLDGPQQWSAGAYYQNSTDNTHQSAPSLGFPFDYEAERSLDSYAIFGETTRSFGDDLFEITGGLRYYNSETELSAISDFVTGTAGLAPPETASAEKVTGRLVLTLHPTDGQLVYASASTGFRSGLPRSQAIAAVDPSFPAVAPDSLISYEVGAKGDFFNGTLRYTAALYYQDWSDIQQTVTLSNNFTAFTNAGNASGPGFEGSLAIRAAPGLELGASVGWNDLTFSEDVPSGSVILFRQGDRINNSPEWTGSISLDYTTPTPLSDFNAVFSSTLTYNSPNAQRQKVGNAVLVSESDPIYLLGASVGLENDRWGVRLFGDNLLDEDGAISVGLTAGSDFINDVSLRPRPRTIGLQLTFDY